MKTLFQIGLLLFAFIINAQPPLHKIYNNNQTYCKFNSAIVVDSGYIVQGMAAKEAHLNQPESFLVFIDTLGNENFFFEYWDENNFQNAAFNRDKLILNEFGNYEFAFNNFKPGEAYSSRLRFLEVSDNGSIIEDFKFDTLNTHFNYNLLDNCSMLNRHGFRWFSVNSGENNSDFSSRFVNVLKVNSSNSIIERIEFRDDTDTYGQIPQNMIWDTDTTILLNINRYKQSPPPYDDELIETMLVRLDTNLNVLDSKIIADENYARFNHIGLLSLQDKIIITYWQGEFFYSNENQTQGGWYYLKTVSALDKNFNVLWKTHSDSLYTNVVEYGPPEIVAVDDSTFLAASTSFSKETIDLDIWSQQVVTKLDKMNLDGETLWSREHVLFPELPVIETYPTHIYEVIQTKDDGFLVIGNNNKDGYLLKTNCLGFLGSPVSNFTTTIQDNFTVSFNNQSIQAGSYHWDFGDGTTLRTSEYQDHVTHNYAGYGNYTVTLIAEGCNGDNDTIQTTVEPKKHADAQTTVENDNGYFAIFPNPAESGSAVYIYITETLNVAKTTLKISNQLGKEVYTQKFIAKEGSYQIPTILSTGVYNFTLTTADKIINKKLVVK